MNNVQTLHQHLLAIRAFATADLIDIYKKKVSLKYIKDTYQSYDRKITDTMNDILTAAYTLPEAQACLQDTFDTLELPDDRLNPFDTFELQDDRLNLVNELKHLVAEEGKDGTICHELYQCTCEKCDDLLAFTRDTLLKEIETNQYPQVYFDYDRFLVKLTDATICHRLMAALNADEMK